MKGPEKLTTSFSAKSFGLGVLAVAMFILAGPANAASGTFYNPKHGGDRLDWCLNWGVGCGKQAANAYCKKRGYKKATSFQIAPNIGATQRTRLIGTGAVCDQGFCDGFKRITCYKPSPVKKTFYKPKWNGNRLDWCVNWAQGCGKPAANAYCKAKGYFKGATAWKMQPNIGASQPTRLIGTGAVCDQGFCDGFQYVTCKKS